MQEAGEDSDMSCSNKRGFELNVFSTQISKSVSLDIVEKKKR